MAPRSKRPPQISGDPLWYKDGVVYQLHVRAYFDSNNDGIGDFPGLTQKLDYLQDLGVTAIWLLPFYPSPLRDDGYDIGDYTSIHPSYGSMRDFKVFLKEAHRRGLRVITELVINHTSDQHEWFQRSRRAKKGSSWRDFYVWSDTPDKYKATRIIFKDFEASNWTWDPVAKAYFWHRFFHHQPDLNFDNPAVHRAVEQVLDQWMDMGVDGLRLDAVPYLYEREGTSNENLPETHEYLKKLRKHVDEKYGDRMLLAEANQWPEDTRPYFGDGDECHVAFHFPLMPRLFMSLAMEDRYPIIDIMQQTPDIPDICQWALFLRNHDELTLEMVTDEDRDYMWRVYAADAQARINLGIRRRLAPLMQNQRRKIELLNAMLFSFPGTPFIYYGDEIGMGDNIYLGDRNGVRTPMQWSPDRNAGFSRANPQRLYLPTIIDPEYHYEAVNVEAQQNNQNSLLWWTKRLIDVRKRSRALGRGKLDFLHPENRKVLAFVRSYENERVLVVANLSRFVQFVELDLGAYDGMVPVELFGRVEFPRIAKSPYMLTLSPHSFYWFQLEDRVASSPIELSSAGRSAVVQGESLKDIYEAHRAELDAALERYIPSRRWFAAKSRTIKSVETVDLVALRESPASIAVVRIEYLEGSEELYVVPLMITWNVEIDNLDQQHVEVAVARVQAKKRVGVMHEAIHDREFAIGLLNAVGGRRSLKGEEGELLASKTRVFPKRLAESAEPSALKAEQSNTSIAFGDQYYLKIFRRLEQGINTDLEVTSYLTEKTSFRNISPLLGSVSYRTPSNVEMALAIVQKFTPNGGDAWRYTLDVLGRYFDRILSKPITADQMDEAFPRAPLTTLIDRPLPPIALALLESYVADAELIGRRTGELHSALAQATEPAFVPEPFTPFYQRSLYQSFRTQATQATQLVKKRLKTFPDATRKEAERLLTHETDLQNRLRGILGHTIEAKRTRIHGDYHLGQLLYTGKDFVVTDFEGEPARPLSERRIKRSPLKDVAGMLRSFHYAPFSILLGKAEGVRVRTEDVTILEDAARFWQQWVSVVFLQSYVAATAEAKILPTDRAQFKALLDAYLLEKALYELAYEINNRPDWIGIPLRGILQLLEASS